MKPHLLDLLDDSAELAPWLDRGLVGIHLGEIVAELEAVHAGRSSSPSPSLDAVLGDHGADVLRRGLAALPASKLRALLRSPRLLLDLQERVLLQGGDYWNQMGRKDEELSRVVSESWSAIERRHESSEPSSSTVIPFQPARPHAPVTRSFWLQAWAKMATVAASLLAVLYASELIDTSQRGSLKTPRVVTRLRRVCGWNDDALFTRVEPASAFLNHLADAAAECLEPPTETAEALAQRLGEFRVGCTRLIVAVSEKRVGLDDADRNWLLERCRSWAGKLDAAIHDLENDVPAKNVRKNTDDILRHLLDALRGRAKEIA